MDSSFFTSDTIDNVSTSFLLKKGNYFDIYKVKVGLRWYIRKQLSPYYKDSDFHIQLLKKEFEIGQYLEHENIVKYLYLNKDDSGCFILMDFIEGISLDEVLKYDASSKISSPHSFIQSFIKQVESALTYLHNKNIYHADLSLKNIVYNVVHKKFYLIDFGHASSINYIDIGGGTKHFIAPEAIDTPNKIDASTDVFSFGKILSKISLYYEIETYNSVIKKACESEQHLRYKNVETFAIAIQRKYRFQKCSPIFIGASLIILLFLTIYFTNRKHQIQLSKNLILDSVTTVKSLPNKNVNSLNKETIESSRNILPKRVEVNKNSEAKVIQQFSFLEDFKSSLKKDITIDEMRRIRNECILSAYNKFEIFLSNTILTEKQKRTLKEAYTKNYFLEYKKSESLITANLK